MSATILSYTDTVLRYFNPSRSPFYGIIAIGVISVDVVSTSTAHKADSRWMVVNAVLLSVIAIGVRFSLASRSQMSKQEYTDQLFFARSICVSAALIAVAYFFDTYTDDLRFLVVLGLSVLQAITFLIYIWADPDAPGDLEDTNLVQLGLITTTLLLGAFFVMKEIPASLTNTSIWSGALQPNLPAIVLFILWLCCLRVWWRIIGKLVIFFGRRSIARESTGTYVAHPANERGQGIMSD
jgi:hypothetical protein